MEVTNLCAMVKTKGKSNKRWLFRGQSPASVIHPGLCSNYREGGLVTLEGEGGQTQAPVLTGLEMPAWEVLEAGGNGCFLFSSLIPLNKTGVK